MMHCERCGHDNNLTARFCEECGDALRRSCSSCGETVSGTAKFCEHCGTATATAAPPVVRGAVRKQVTALFADLVGSTAFGERVDPEAARAALAPYFEILRSAVEDHAGTVVKFTGDGVLAVFGLPEVAEDDARRAVAAGQDLQRRFGALAASVRDRHGVELGLRVGVNSGELVVGDDDEDLVGDVLNTAARLEAACVPGRVLVGEDTWRLTRSNVRYEVLGDIRVKGKADPIATFQVAELPDAAIEENIPFVGRGDELAELLDAFAEARDSPVLQLVTVVGDPGVGKTRLASEVRGATSARSFDLRFERRGSTTFGPIADLLRLVTDGTADGVARLFDEHAERDRLVPILSSMLGHDAVRSTEESFWGVRRLLEQLAELHGPLLVVVDDIQWAEPLFWDLLDHLVEWTEAPVLVIALARPELRELRPELTQAGRRVAASIALDGLGADDTRELAARLLDVEELPRELTDRIPASTDGNPLFVRELINMLVDDGTLERDGERWRLTIDADAIDVPPTILSLLASRVERLPDDERRAIELASVIGTDFDRGTLAAIASEEGSTGPLGVVLDRLRRRDLVEPSGAWSGDHPVYRFHHVLVRDAAYRRLLKERRATLHELVGRHVDEHHPDGDETDVVVAHHFEQVVRYRRDLGTVDAATDELASDAVVRLRRAADSALAREDLPAAGSAAQRALDLVSDDSAERDELLLVGCEALLSSGDVTAAEPLVSELADRSTDDRLAAWAACFRAQRWSLTDPDRLVEATDTADRAADALASLDDAAGVAKARLVRAGCLARLGRVGECEDELDLALGAARDAGDRRRTVAVLGAAPLAALWGPSPVSRAGGRCLDVLRLLRITAASPAVETTSIRCQAVLEALRGRLDSARDKLEQSRSTSQELGLRQGLFETELFAGFVELWAGDPGAAEPHLRAAHEGLGRLGIGADAGQAAALLARALLDRGDLDAADTLATEAFDSAGQNLQTAITSRSALAEVRAAQGRHEEAAALAAEAVEIAGRTDIVLDHALAVEAAGRVAQQAGDPGAAAAAQSDARRLLADKGVTADRGSEPGGEQSPEPPPAERRKPEPESAVDAGPSGSVSETGRNRRGGLTDAVRSPTSAGESTGWDVIEAAVGAWLANDETAWRGWYAPDFLGAGREHLSTHRTDVGLDEWTTASFDLRRQVTEVDVTVERIAQRGDHWFVTRSVGAADGNEIGFVFVSQVVAGRIRRETILDPSQLDEAIALADDGFDVENGVDDIAWLRELRAAMYTVDPEILGRRFHEDYVQRDHRPIAWPDLTRDELMAAVGSNPFKATVPVVWRYSESGSLFHRIEATADGGSSVEMLLVAEYRDQLVHRIDLFEEADLEAALARYDEVTSSRVWRWNLDFYERMLAGDRDGYDRKFTPDATFEVRRASSPPFSGPIGVFIDQHIMSWVDVGVEGIDSDLIEEHGDDRCLIRATVTTTAGDRSSILFVSELDAEGRGTRFVTFDHDQIVDALAELRSVTVDPNDPMGSLESGRDAVVPGRGAYVDRVSLAIAVGPLDVFAACFATDFVVVDRRAMGLGTRDLAAFIESNMALVGNVIAWTAETIEMSETAALTRVEVRSTVDESSWAMLLLAEYARPGDDELITRWTQFDVHDRAAAIESFRALDRGHSALPPLTNEANEIVVRFLEARNEGDWDAVLSTLHPDLEARRQRPEIDALGLSSRKGRAEWIDGLRNGGNAISDVVQGAPRLQRREVLAVRGDQLVLARSVEVIDGNELPYLMLAECREGQIITLTQWPREQLGEAARELDRLCVELGGGPLDDFARQFGVALSTRDLTDLERLLSPSFERVDHRPLGLGRRDRAEYLRSAGVTLDLDLVFLLRQTFAATDRCSFDAAAGFAGDDVAFDGVSITLLDDDGRLELQEVFDVAQFEQARRRFDELTSNVAPHDRGLRFELSNREVELSRENLRIWPRDADHVDRFFEPDFEWTVRRTGSIKLDGDLSTYLDVAEFWTSVDATIELDVLAVRGDVLSLKRYTVRNASGDEQVIYNVAEVGPSVRWCRIVVFGDDQLGEAVVELERRWSELNGGPLDDYAHRWVAAYVRRDIGEVERLLAPTFETVDHRSIGLGRRGRAAFLESTVPLVAHGVVFLMAQQIETSDRCVLAAASVIAGDDLMFRGYTITLLDEDGRSELGESFDITQLELARRRFHELTDELDRQRFTNVAAQLVERMWSADTHGDVDEMSRLLDPSFQSENRRPAHAALAVPPGDFETLVSRTGARNQRFADEDLERLADRVIVAIRGDDLAAGIGVADTDGYLVSFAGVAESHEGRLVWLCVWDESDMQEALDELDRRWVERGGPAPLVDAMARVRRLGRDGDMAGVEAFVSLDLESVDHRSLGMSVRGYRECVDSMTPLAGRCEFVMHEVLEHTDRIGLIRGTVSQADEGSWELLYLLRVDGDGRVDRYEIFEWSDIELARIRFEELVAESAIDPDDAFTEEILGLTNSADRLSRQMIDAQARCDLDEVDAVLHPDFVFDERSAAFTAPGGRVETKAEYLADLREQIEQVDGDVQATSDRFVIAVRGDDLCLTRGVVTRDGFVRPYLALVDIEDGLIRRVVFWDEDQFHDAVDELNRCWVERGGSQLWAAMDRRFSSVFRSGTDDDLDALVGPVFLSVDHRPLGLGERGRDEWLASAGAVVGQATAIVRSALVRGRVRLARVSFVVNHDDSTLMDGLAIGVLDAEGRFERQELFSLDQWDDARARFEELSA